ncbi:MAG: cellobiose phosphorylase [Elusimicrobia bacterium]|nr:cellobiose phosphorylase [Elusimicrobiota bacterium]
MVSAYVKEEDEVKYRLHDDGTFEIDNYNLARPFASFFPGIAGLKGIPMWLFYVNRGQGIASFGIKSKNHSIMEFQPADRAYGLTPNIGFRTFIKVKPQDRTVFYEPFMNNTANNAFKTRQKMLIQPAELNLEEVNESLGLKVLVKYFTLPQEPIAALVRIVEVINSGAKDINLEIIDGQPKIIPYGMSNNALKYMSHTAQAWAKVTNFDNNRLPFYKLKVEISDKPEVQELREGNFYFALENINGELQPAQMIIDPELIFGEVTDYNYPSAFIKQQDFILPVKQFGDNKYPAAMSLIRWTLPAGQGRTLYSLIGHVDSEEQLNDYCQKVKNIEYFNRKGEENKQIVQEITTPIQTQSSRLEFNLYCRQTYLDNVLRGGRPINLPAGDGSIPFFVYARKHGDLERDYNNYLLSPTYYSQGDGNFRDINQNKRSDIFFDPKTGDTNVLTFYNLVQLDGYNPLLVKETHFIFKAGTTENKKALARITDKKGGELLTRFFAKQFEPGSLLLFIEQNKINLKVAEEQLWREIFGRAQRVKEAEHGEGFWIDHWTYNLDLLETYLAVYPEKEREILLEKKEFTFYDNAHIVLPRQEKYVDANGLIRQFGAVLTSPEKAARLKERASNIHLVRDKKGQGSIYKTTLLTKMTCLLVNKLATLDPDGIGIEMEADKPSWYDALNGLPGVFGSSVSETFELKRMIQFLQGHLEKFGIAGNYSINLPEEMHRFFLGLQSLLVSAAKLSVYNFWDKATALKEKYREDIKFGISGKEKPVRGVDYMKFLEMSLKKIDTGLAKALDPGSGLYYTYYIHEAEKFSYIKGKKGKKHSSKGWPCVTIKKFRKQPLPLFLEAEVHYLKTEKSHNKVKQLYEAMKKSPLYDKELGMYKVNASLEKEPADIGRCTVFAPGWLENESIWLHMEYKYLLELLNSGLYEEFFAEFEKAGVCFQEASIYGRSILENSSFIVSSAFPDSRMWGRGCVARLSGSTAEFLEIWILMTVGGKPFKINAQEELILEFKPALPKNYFTREGIFSCQFLGTTQLVYHNSRQIDTFASEFKIETIEVAWLNGNKEKIQGSIISKNLAEKIRNQEAKQVDIYF